MLFERDAHQLTPCAYAGLLEKLLQHCLDRALRNRQPSSNFLVREPLEDTFQHSLLSLSQALRALWLRRVPAGRGDDRPGYGRIQPYLAREYFTNRIHQSVWRTMFEKYSRRPVLQRAKHRDVAHPCRHQQNPSRETGRPGSVEEERALFRP
jgi:hypothetical protein